MHGPMNVKKKKEKEKKKVQGVVFSVPTENILDENSVLPTPHKRMFNELLYISQLPHLLISVHEDY
jgi:hypothetical protein